MIMNVLRFQLLRPLFPILVLIAVCGAARLRAAEETPAASPPASATPDRAALEKKFEETLTDCQMIGSFTVTGQDKDKPLNEDKYTIASVKKMKNDYWVFESRIQYNNKDTKVRLPLEVKWAGDTPVITLTKVLVPGMGTFTARVLIYENEYAGTWSAGDHGGHMFGRIIKAGSEPDKKTGDTAAKTDGEKKPGAGPPF
jgi:hypothetical protein